MNVFSIAVYRPVTATAREIVAVPGTLSITPRSWSAIAKGGTWDAEIAVTGALADLTALTAWLGYIIEIINDRGTVVWWGDIATVEITADGTRRGVSLDRLSNRIMVRYSQKQPGGGVAAADTTWVENALSKATYGTFERRLTPGRDMTSNEATALRSTALATLSEPHYSLVPATGATAARLYCTGHWQRTKRTYHTELRGLEQHNVNGAAYPLGLGIVASNQFGFAARAKSISHISGYFANFANDMRVRVTGAFVAGNNTTYTVTGTDDRDAVTYSSAGVSFDPADDITDSNAGLAFINNDDVFQITGSTGNSGTHIMDKAGARAVEVNGTFHGGAIVGEAAGPSITFYRGNAIQVTPTPTNEHLGNSVTATAWGERYYQTFTLSANAGSWTVDAIEIRVRRVGGPTDNVKVQLYSDSAGSPGSLLKEATVAADNIPLDMAWVSFDLDNAQLLSYSNTYGIVVSRTGANHYANYYEVELDATASYAGGTCKAYDGAAYQTLSPTCDLVFRVLGGVDTGTQAGNVLRTQSWAEVDTVSSGIVSNQYRNGELRAFDELNALLDTGTSAGVRLLARSTTKAAVTIYVKPDRSTARFVLQAGNRLTDLHGQDADPGLLPAGEWVRLGDTAGLGPWAALSPVFVERAEYTPTGGWNLTPEGAEDVFDLGVENG